MDVKFTTVKKSSLGTVPVIDGQIIALSDYTGFYYDLGSTRRSAGSIRIASSLSGKGNPGELLAVTSGNDQGLYVWDESSNSYMLIASKDTDTYMSFVKDESKTKMYITSTDGDSNSKYIYWNDNVYANPKEGSITASAFHGKADSSYKSDSSVKADKADSSSYADKAAKLDVPDSGNPEIGIYVKDGKPVQCSHSVKSDVPENAKFTDTTYSTFKPATANSQGSQGLVTAPPAGGMSKYLRGDGTWGNDTIPAMTGCTSSSNGSQGSVPAPIKGDQSKVLRGNGTWQSLNAGEGLEFNNFSYNLKNSGVAPGVYGPESNQSDGITYIGDYIEVPQITVDRYGRVTSIKEIRCKLNGTSSSTDPKPSKPVTFAKFHINDDNLLSVDYEDPDTTLATFSVDSDYNLKAQYNRNPTPYTLERKDDHVYAISVTDSQDVVDLGKVVMTGDSDD